MVGRSHPGLLPNDREDGPTQDNKKDVETGGMGRKRLFRFRDIANTAMEDRRREELKRQLLEGVDREGLEKYRKSDDEVSGVPYGMEWMEWTDIWRYPGQRKTDGVIAYTAQANEEQEAPGILRGAERPAE